MTPEELKRKQEGQDIYIPKRYASRQNQNRFDHIKREVEESDQQEPFDHEYFMRLKELIDKRLEILEELKRRELESQFSITDVKKMNLQTDSIPKEE